MGLDQTARFTTYQNQLAGVSQGVQREKEALEAAIARVDQAVSSLSTLQTEFFELSVNIDTLHDEDPTNQAFVNQKSQKDQQIPDFTDLRDDASGMATALDPWRNA